MTQKQEIGKLGERLAADYLKNKRYKILHRNYRHKWGDEIDIIAKSKERVLVFVEVKTLWESRIRNQEFGNSEILRPEDNLNFAKLRKLKRSCQFFANAHPELVGDRGWRIDLVAVDIIDNDLTDKSSNCGIRHYENI